MYRNSMKDLIKWKDNINRKPMILRGARQVGKTWLMKEFGEKYYKSYVYFNFDEETQLKSIFAQNKVPVRIIEILSIISGVKILPNETLIIFDEVQECADALNSLKYFYENANEYHIICAGSLLGTLLSTPKSYPVGMVDLLDINPLSFDEFLNAVDENLFSYYNNLNKDSIVEDIFHNKLLEMYDIYLIIGGMPECVYSWINNKDPFEIQKIQHNLIQIYENDFSKHNGRINSGRLLIVFRSIVSQLTKSNEKFIYNTLREGARARDFEEAIEWLSSAGMINRLYGLSKVEHPLNAFKKLDAFKLFLFDTGLLKQMAGLDNSVILLQENYQFKGPLTENYVLQQLISSFSVNPHYYSNKHSELDFIVELKGETIPIEVKGGIDKSSISFKKFITENNPKIAIRYSRRPLKKDGKIINIPLYLVNKTFDLIG